MDSSVIALVLLMGVGAEYALRSMMLEEKDSHEGPFRSSKQTRLVRFKSSGHEQHVALFDWIRRLTGAYEVSSEFGTEVWLVDESRVQVQRWTCPHCASMWTSLPFSLGLAFAYCGLSLAFLAWLIPIHLGIAVISQVIYRHLWDNDE